MGYLLPRLCSFAGLLAISGVALAADDFFNVPEPGVLELVVIAVGTVPAASRQTVEADRPIANFASSQPRGT